MPSEPTFTPAEPRRSPRPRGTTSAGSSTASVESPPVTGEADESSTADESTTTESTEPSTASTASTDAPRELEPAPRTGVRLGVASTRRAFATADRTTGVEAIQRALVDRGYDVGSIDALAGPRTRRAFARFREDAGLDATTGPDRRSLDLLGFDVVGSDDTER